MAGRFPFDDAGDQRNQQQLTSAQMRVALGLAGVTDDTSFYLQQHQQGLQQASLQQSSLQQAGLGQVGLQQNGLQQNGLQQNGLQQNGLQQNGLQQSSLQQVTLSQAGLSQGFTQAALHQAGLQQTTEETLRLRAQQLLNRDQLERLLEEQQLRAMSDQLNDFPDLQQHYSRMLLSEQLMQHEERAFLQEQERAVAEEAARQQVAQQRYQDDVRLHQLHLADQAQEAHLKGLVQAQVQAQAQNVYGSYNQQQQPAPSTVGSILQAQPLHVQSPSPMSLTAPSPTFTRQYGHEAPIEVDTAAMMPAAMPAADMSQVALQRKRSYSKDSGEEHEPSLKRPASDTKKSKIKGRKGISKASEKSKTIHKLTPTSALEKVALAAEMATPQIVNHGTVLELLEAAEDEQIADDAASTMGLFKDVDWPDTESEPEVEQEQEPEEQKEEELQVEEGFGLRVPTEPAESIILPQFRSLFPKLPEEPLYDDSAMVVDDGDGMAEDGNATNEKSPAKESPAKSDTELFLHGGVQSDSMPNKVSNVLDYPFPVDIWWPSSTGIGRERRSAGETSDEDDFEDQPCTDHLPFRANERKIRHSLATKAEPGVLEKLPHCKLHRIRTKRKKNSTAPELVYCWQVTEIYPNEIMVNCSACGTWRHAACGGHHESYSSRENANRPFVGLCDFCKQEETFLEDCPQGQRRIERQRLEQLRRGFATSAVMRHSSYSKHGGTYKWPLGSVSATHIGGHTRSVHARHDKAEKQWTDMASRLGRGYGYRPKERVRVRTKELERLLVSVEDAEIFTDRHNMLLFLMRDTAKQHPVGFEGHRRNIFDPVEDELPQIGNGNEQVALIESSTSGSELNAGKEGDTDGTEDEAAVPEACVRPGCSGQPRFDSLFCSDSCGVSVLETDLLQTFQDASEIHPSVLRH